MERRREDDRSFPGTGREDLSTPAPRLAARHPLKGATLAARQSRFRGVLGELPRDPPRLQLSPFFFWQYRCLMGLHAGPCTSGLPHLIFPFRSPPCLTPL
ncbi:hypothetical protein F3K02_26845 [Hydrogenophaga sp. D2P1]|uniref:Uncharacterized protein n=1 Tax=Hydrogenophaga aromaticivorans TaxID=2610898 RepID=A0A7Y8H1N3_9BURK|nr:hypothetical protein [Hydrogenophaga aromaticivorans]